MDALREWMESDLDVIMVGTWMLCGNGWSLIWTISWSLIWMLSWLAHGCSNVPTQHNIFAVDALKSESLMARAKSMISLVDKTSKDA